MVVVAQHPASCNIAASSLWVGAGLAGPSTEISHVCVRCTTGRLCMLRLSSCWTWIQTLRSASKNVLGTSHNWTPLNGKLRFQAPSKTCAFHAVSPCMPLQASCMPQTHRKICAIATSSALVIVLCPNALHCVRRAVLSVLGPPNLGDKRTVCSRHFSYYAEGMKMTISTQTHVQTWRLNPRNLVCATIGRSPRPYTTKQIIAHKMLAGPLQL
jgi:hypothetical protein